MDMKRAFHDTIAAAVRGGMPEGQPGDGLGLAHLRSMSERITDDFSQAKLGRWLGWAQCAVVAAGCATLDDMKEINRQHAG